MGTNFREFVSKFQISNLFEENMPKWHLFNSGHLSRLQWVNSFNDTVALLWLGKNGVFANVHRYSSHLTLNLPEDTFKHIFIFYHFSLLNERQGRIYAAVSKPCLWHGEVKNQCGPDVDIGLLGFSNFQKFDILSFDFQCVSRSVDAYS